MKIRVLGCHGSEFQGGQTTAFLINDCLLLDAGTVASALTLDEQRKIRSILITHPHLDHTKDILFLADNIIVENRASIEVVSIPEVLEILKSYLLNDKIWPDFTILPTADDPILRFRSIKTGEDIRIGGLTVKAISVNHTVDAIGYIVRDETSSILYTGDTGPTDKIWEEANKLSNLKAVIVETSFPNHLHKLAEMSGHLTPMMLRDQLNKLKNFNSSILIFHMKPQYLPELENEITKLENLNIIILKQGKVFEF